MARADATLPGITPEVFELIAEKAAETDLLSLRAVCREARDKCQRLFVQTFFSRRSVLLSSPKSLRMTAEIAADDTFGPVLQKITLMVDKIQPSVYGKLDKDDEKEYYAEQEDLEKSGTDVRLLKTIFCELAKHGNTLEIELSDLDAVYGRSSGYGDSRSFRDRLPRRVFQPHGEMRFFEILVQALRTQKVIITSLTSGKDTASYSVCWRNRSWALSPADIKSESFSAWSAIFPHLRCITLYAYMRGRYDTGRDTSELTAERSTMLFKALASLPNLEALAVQSIAHSTADTEWGGDSDPGRHILVDALVEHKFPKLRELTLEDQDIMFEQLVDFVGRQPVLQKLRLITVNLSDDPYEVEPDEESVLGKLKESTRLQEVTLDNSGWPMIIYM